MKPKRPNKKLSLNKSTVADLNGREMKIVKGGCDYTQPQSCQSIRLCPTEFTCATDCGATCLGTCEPSECQTNCNSLPYNCCT